MNYDKIEQIYSNIQKKEDNTFVVIKDGYPYHIPNTSEFKEEYDLISTFIKTYPDKVSQYVEKVYIPTEDKQAQIIRNKRDALINEADILLLKYQEQVELGVINANDDYRLSLLQYKENLRNVPEQAGFPMNVVWPEIPARK